MSKAHSTGVTYAGLAADDVGGDEGPPLVLLHGLTFDRHSWRPIIDHVRSIDPDRRIVAFDLPGHGESHSQPPHDFEHILSVLHQAFHAAGIDRPVLVGHSMSGGLASLFGALHPVAAIVNVDQPPDIGPFARLVRSLQDELRGPRFADVWQMFANSFHTELLPADARSLVEANSAPAQDLVLSYWEPLLARPVDDLSAEVDRAVRAIGTLQVPYALILGTSPPPQLEAWLRHSVPQVRIEDWSPSGHFPHLSHPERFAELLLEMGR
jgi:pimeloyl-ACP methyl ester carboxylesterase